MLPSFQSTTPPLSLSLLLSRCMKGHWISPFHVTSSVFDFYAYLKLAMGLTLRPLISPVRNYSVYLVYLMMAP